MICDPDPPSYLVLKQTRPRAKKQYICCLCREPIDKGVKHVKVAYLDDDNKFKSDRHHTISLQGECMK